LVLLWLMFILLSSRKEVSLISICLPFYNLKIVLRISIISTLWFQPSFLILSFSYFFMQKLLSICCIVHVVLIIPKLSVWLMDNVVNAFLKTIEKEYTRLRTVIHSILDLTMAWYLNTIGLGSPINMWSFISSTFSFLWLSYQYRGLCWIRNCQVSKQIHLQGSWQGNYGNW